jgi:hypothetical protein
MSWKLYLDDIRTPADESFVIARSAEEAKRLILRKDMPSHISFDHDLGMDDDGNLLPSGYDFAKWLVELDIKGVIQIADDFTFKIHSQNPIGAQNIKGLLDGYLREKDYCSNL